jgi:hypothetical protein
VLNTVSHVSPCLIFAGEARSVTFLPFKAFINVPHTLQRLEKCEAFTKVISKVYKRKLWGKINENTFFSKFSFKKHFYVILLVSSICSLSIFKPTAFV